MNKDFLRAHEFTALYEGGYVDHPADPGGETNLGVTKSVWAAWCRSKGIKQKRMRDLTMADVLPLYEERYWAPMAARLPWPLSAAIYDMSVNHGIGDGRVDEVFEEGATHMLQQALKRKPNGTALEQALAACDAREDFYRAIVRRRPASQVFMKGWMRRVNAHRVWLRENAKPLPVKPPAPVKPVEIPALPPQRLWLVPKGGGEATAWNGRDNPYGGNVLGPELLAALDLAYPQPGGPWDYGTVKIWRRRDGTFVLERR